MLRHAHASIDVGSYELSLGLGLVMPPPAPYPPMPAYPADMPQNQQWATTTSADNSVGSGQFAAPPQPSGMEGMTFGAGDQPRVGLLAGGPVLDFLKNNKAQLLPWAQFIASLFGVKLPPLPAFDKPM